jgi:DNA-binding YbaB/EbfC family protein
MDLSKLMKQAQNLQKEMAVAQKQIDALEIQGSAGGGLVRVTLSGKGHLIAINLDATLPNDEVLEDLIIAAHNDATNQLEQSKSKIMGPMGGMAQQIPGFS